MAFQSALNFNTITTALLLAVFISCHITVFTRHVPHFACNTAENPDLMNFPFCDTSLDIETRVNDLISRLTLEEKINNLVSNASGVPRLGIPGYKWWSEALHGVSNVGPATHFSRLVPGATSFPQVILTAASFNKTLFKTIGKVVSTEARAMYNVGLAGLTYWSPNVNIFRDPRWGRGQETPGEDPVLTSKYAENYVRGLQDRDDDDKSRLKVAASCKHYTAYDVDKWEGIDRFHFDATVTRQDMEDTFQPPFKSCVVDGNVASIMCSYNKVNGKPTCGDPDLLQGIIRDQWNLNGYIGSDCDSLDVMFRLQHWEQTPAEVAADALNAGLDLNCGDYLRYNTLGAVNDGLVEEAVVDKAASHNFATLMRLGFFDGDPREQMYGELGPEDVCTEAHQELAREAARQGIVLLKNSFGSLPLSPDAIGSLAVIGPNADATTTMLGNYAGIPCQYTSPLQGLTNSVSTVYHAGCSNTRCATAQLEEAREAAASADAVVLVMGTDLSVENEGRDRLSISLPGQQNRLISEVASASKGPVILVIMSGGGMDIEFAKRNPKITSILWVGFPGEAGGAALADIIFGRYNPSGRLPMTWYPQSFAETVNMTNMNMRPDPITGHPGYTYRFYRGETVYPFGYGLSYSMFVQRVVKPPTRHLHISLDEGHICGSSECTTVAVGDLICDNLAFDIMIGVRNVGEMAGSYSVLLLSYPPQVFPNVPLVQLVDFHKVFLAPKETTIVTYNMDACRHLSVVDEYGNRRIALGEHVLNVGDVTHSLFLSV